MCRTDIVKDSSDALYSAKPGESKAQLTQVFPSCSNTPEDVVSAT